MSNSPQPNASFSSTLSNLKRVADCPVGSCLQETHPSGQPFAPVCNLLSNLFGYVEQPSDRTFEPNFHETGHYKLALVTLYPSMTSTHEVREGLDSVTTREAIGSIHAFVHEAAYLLIASHHHFRKSNVAPNGQIEEPYTHDLTIETLPPSYFQIDPIAVNQYASLVQSLQARGTQVVYVVPPNFGPFYDQNRASYDDYVVRIRRLVPQAPIINFLDPEFRSLRSDPSNFNDCYHMTPQGADQIRIILEKLVPSIVSSASTNSPLSSSTFERTDPN